MSKVNFFICLLFAPCFLMACLDGGVENNAKIEIDEVDKTILSVQDSLKSYSGSSISWEVVEKLD